MFLNFWWFPDFISCNKTRSQSCVLDVKVSQHVCRYEVRMLVWKKSLKNTIFKTFPFAEITDSWIVFIRDGNPARGKVPACGDGRRGGHGYFLQVCIFIVFKINNINDEFVSFFVFMMVPQELAPCFFYSDNAFTIKFLTRFVWIYSSCGYCNQFVTACYILPQFWLDWKECLIWWRGQPLSAASETATTAKPKLVISVRG